MHLLIKMLNLLWNQLKSKLHPSEIDESLFILGPSKVERNEDIAQEILSLLGLFEEIPSRFQDLPSHKQQVQFYLSKLGSKAKELGLQTTDLLSLRTPREKHIFDFLSDGGNTRPQTAESTISIYEELPMHIGFDFIEGHRSKLIKSLDAEYKFLKERAEALQQELLMQALVPSAKEVAKFSKKLEVGGI